MISELQEAGIAEMRQDNEGMSIRVSSTVEQIVAEQGARHFVCRSHEELLEMNSRIETTMREIRERERILRDEMSQWQLKSETMLQNLDVSWSIQWQESIQVTSRI